MGIEIIIKEDLEEFRYLLLHEIENLLTSHKKVALRDWLKSCEVTKLLKISIAKLQNLRIKRKLHGVKVEGTWYYNTESIKSLFKKGAETY